MLKDIRDLHDYENALILGLIIGIFLIPFEINVGLTHKIPFIIWIGIFGFPIGALLGTVVARFLFSNIPAIWQFIKFGLTGVSNTAINFGILNLLILATGKAKGAEAALFEAIAFIFALMNSYFWNSHWSFKNTNPRTIQEFTKFFIITGIGLLLSSGIVYFITKQVHPLAGMSAGRWANVANLVATLIVMFWNFSGFKFLVFKSSATSVPNTTNV